MTYILTVLLLGFLILIHEIGHFQAARLMHLPVAKFSIGFGPALLKWRKDGIEYRLSAIPLGGYVMLGVSDEKEYLALPLMKRIIFSLAGPAANLVLALPLYMVLNTLEGFSLTGLLIRPFGQVWMMIGRMLDSFQLLFSQPQAMNGILGIIAEGGKFMGLGAAQGVSLAIILTVNLAVFNLFPLPPLDGGKIVLDLLHRFGSRLAKLYVPVTAIGLLLICGIMVYATVLDIFRLIA